MAERDAFKSRAETSSFSSYSADQKRIQYVENQLETLRKERVDLHSRLRESQRVIQELRENGAILQKEREKELSILKEESLASKKRVTFLEKALREADRQTRRNTIDESVERLKKEIFKCQEEKAMTITRVKKLEAEVRFLRAELSKVGREGPCQSAPPSAERVRFSKTSNCF